MAPVVIPGVDLPLITGPLILGYLWSYCLYGMLIVQVYMYSQVFTKDILGIKILVWSMFTLETVFTIFCTIAAWNEFGVGWGDLNTLVVIDWSWEPLPALDSILAAMAQCFYMWRIYRLTQKRWLVAIICCPMIAHLAASFYYGIGVSVQDRTFQHLTESFSPQITTWLAGAAICDFLITISLVLILWRQKQATSVKRTTTIINRLIRFSVETGSVTSLAAIVELILWLAVRQVNFHFILFLVIGKLYSNMLMASLNSRAPMFQTENTTMVSQMQSSFWAEPSPKNSNLRGGSRDHGGIQIARTTNTDDGTAIVMRDFHASINTEEEQSPDNMQVKSYNSLVA